MGVARHHKTKQTNLNLVLNITKTKQANPTTNNYGILLHPQLSRDQSINPAFHVIEKSTLSETRTR